MNSDFKASSLADQQSVWRSPAHASSQAPGVQRAAVQPMRCSDSALESGRTARILASAFEARFGFPLGPLFELASTPPPPAGWKDNFEALVELLSKRPIDPDAITLWLQRKLDVVKTVLSMLAMIESGVDKERLNEKIADLDNQWSDMRALLLAVLTAGAAGGRGASAGSDVTWLLYTFAKCHYLVSDVIRWGKYYKKFYEDASKADGK